MSADNQTSSSNRTVLIGAGVLVIAAAFGSYSVGFDKGEAGLIEAQNKMSLLEAASTDQAAKIEQQAAKIEEQTARLGEQDADIAAKASEVQVHLAQIESQKAEITQTTAEIEKLAGLVSLNNTALTQAKGKLSDLTSQLTMADKQNEDYLKTIMAGIGKQDFNLNVGGVHKTLIENQVNMGLSYVSLDRKMARITLAGDQMNVELQSPQKIRLSGKPCELTLANLVSDTEATFQLNCQR